MLIVQFTIGEPGVENKISEVIMGNEPVKNYCDYILKLDKDNVHKIYHDTEYGFPIDSDDELLARLVLEINQAGLSWDTILKKKIISLRPMTISILKK